MVFPKGQPDNAAEDVTMLLSVVKSAYRQPASVSYSRTYCGSASDEEAFHTIALFLFADTEVGE